MVSSSYLNITADITSLSKVGKVQNKSGLATPLDNHIASREVDYEHFTSQNSASIQKVWKEERRFIFIRNEIPPDLVKA